MSQPIITRFAPSPTGELHLGGLRTALFSYALAKQSGGKFLLRIEDTDTKRTQEGSVDGIMEALRWAGLQWDGEIIRQSDRLALYSKYAHMLLSKGLAYRCFCSEERLAALRSSQDGTIQRGYDRHCRNLSDEEISQKLKSLSPYVIRIKLPLEGNTAVKEALRGSIGFTWKQLEDFIILKADGFPTYHLAHVVDDALMGVTHVLRGNEWISTYPVHDFIRQELEFPEPNYVHLPLILDSQGGKLSKRNQAVSVQHFINTGYTKEAMINFLTLLGWSYDDKKTLFSMEELLKYFCIEKISKSSAEFSLQKLNYFNQHYLNTLSDEELYTRALPYVLNAYPHRPHRKNDNNSTCVKGLILLYRSRLKHLSQLAEYLKVFLSTEEITYTSEMWQHKKLTIEQSQKSLQLAYDTFTALKNWDMTSVETSLKDLASKHDMKMFALMMPLRIALAATQSTPSIAQISYYLGKDVCLERIAAAQAFLSSTTYT